MGALVRNVLIAALWGWASFAGADDALVAVAANFSETAEALAVEFAAKTEHTVALVSGSTGKLYAQIRHGAPYSALLAADAERPARLEREGRAVPGSRFTYALGRLVLWSPDAGRVAVVD